jgi:hypothetical protein
MLQISQPIQTQPQTPRLTTADVMLLRTLAQAQSLACGLAQRISDHEWMLYPPTGKPVLCGDLAGARAWLRHYGECGRYGRRCFDVSGRHTCQCHLRSRRAARRRSS